MPISRASAAAVAALGAVPGAAYLASLSPGIRCYVDVGEIQFVGYVLGTAHPTGYPLHTVISWAFTHLVPFGSVAWRANLLSALFALGAVAALFAALRQLGHRRRVAVAAALGFGFVPAWWRQAAMAEVYTLHMLLFGGAWALLFAWRRDRRIGQLRAGLALLALSLGHHLMIVLAVPGVLWLGLATDRGVLRRGREWALAALFLALGLAQYGYLAWRFADPDAAFAHRDSADLKTLWDYATGAVFQDQVGAAGAGLRQRLGVVVGAAGLQTAALAAAGLPAALLMRDRGVGVALALAWLSHAGFAWGYDIGEIAPYLLPLCWIAAVGIADGLERLLPGRAAWAAVAAALALGGLNREAGRRALGEQDAAYVQAIASAAGRDAVLLPGRWELTGALWAHHFTEGGREAGLWVYPEPPGPERAALVAAYLAGEGDLWLAEQRREVPPGLAVYAFEAWAPALEGAGLALAPAGAGMFRVEP